MSVAKVSEISATSSKSFEDALQQGLARANKTLRNVRSAWVKEQQVLVSKGSITDYQVNMLAPSSSTTSAARAGCGRAGHSTGPALR